MTVHNSHLWYSLTVKSPDTYYWNNSEGAKPLEVSLRTYLKDCLGKSLDQEDVDSEEN